MSIAVWLRLGGCCDIWFGSIAEIKFSFPDLCEGPGSIIMDGLAPCVRRRLRSPSADRCVLRLGEVDSKLQGRGPSGMSESRVGFALELMTFSLL